MKHKIWIYNPHKRKGNISANVKSQTQLMCDQFLEKYLWPSFVRPFNINNIKEPQCIDIRWKWRRNFVYCIAIYKDIRRDALREKYDYPFIRLEYVDENLFHLAYFRYTGKWHTITYNMGSSLKQCFRLIQELPHF